MKYHHSFRIRAPLAAVTDFHARSASMGAITPPPIVAQIHQAPARLQEGTEMDFTLWLGPLPIRWVARIENVSYNGFTDRQLRGPFHSWVHRHHFRPVDETSTEVLDEIEAELKKHLFWSLLGLGMWLNMPVLFAYRAWKTKGLLEKKHELDQNCASP
jgi:ligand-binding SRPBCC domain-containing protein